MNPPGRGKSVFFTSFSRSDLTLVDRSNYPGGTPSDTPAAAITERLSSPTNTPGDSSQAVEGPLHSGDAGQSLASTARSPTTFRPWE